MVTTLGAGVHKGGLLLMGPRHRGVTDTPVRKPQREEALTTDPVIHIREKVQSLVKMQHLGKKVSAKSHFCERVSDMHFSCIISIYFK